MYSNMVPKNITVGVSHMTSEEIAVKITEISDATHRNKARIEKLEASQTALQKIAESIEVMANEQKHQTADIKDIRNDVSRLETKVDRVENAPKKKLEQWVDKIAWAVCLSIITFVLAKIGL